MTVSLSGRRSTQSGLEVIHISSNSTVIIEASNNDDSVSEDSTLNHEVNNRITSEPKVNKSGFVYCLTNNLMPGICKVGFTTRSPYDRLKELSGTNLPEDWEVEWAYPFSNPGNIEKSIHKDMNKYRLRPDREFFKMAPKDVYKVLFEKYVTV
jgi:hypothetical protein